MEREANSSISESYHDLVKHDQTRFDQLLGQQSRIVEQRLGLDVERQRPAEQGQMRPMRTRESFRHAAARLERQDRQQVVEHWAKKISEVEARDGVMNATTSEAAENE